jgi:hypothetical protein
MNMVRKKRMNGIATRMMLNNLYMTMPSQILLWSTCSMGDRVAISRTVKKPIRPDDLDHCHPSWFLIRKRTGRAIDDLRSQLVSSPSGVAINKAFASAGADKLQPDSRTPRHDHQFTRRLGGSNVIVHLTSHDIRQARHDAFPWLGETTRCWTSLGDFAQYGNAQRIRSSPAARNFHQT